MKGHVDVDRGEVHQACGGHVRLRIHVPASRGIYYELVSGKTGALLEHAHERRVFPTSATTFTAYLQVIAFGLKGMEFEQNAHEVMAYVADLRNDFLTMRDDFELVGKHLSNARRRSTSTPRSGSTSSTGSSSAPQSTSRRRSTRRISRLSTLPRSPGKRRPTSVYSTSGACRPALYSGVEMTTEGVRELIIIGGGPAGLHGRPLCRASESAPARDRRRPVGRSADDHERRRELPRLSGRRSSGRR